MAEERNIPISLSTAGAEMVQKYSYAPPEMIASIEMTQSEWAVRSRTRTGYMFAKRAFDLVSAACLLLVIWPVLAVIVLAIKLDSKGPAIFKHKRIGQDGRPFSLYKFRSMVTNAEALITKFTPDQKKEWEESYKLSHDPRITRIGSFLRKTSLDELPQLLNILQGTLSVVGPRPVIGSELEKYGGNKWRFLSAKPGLTGYWQAYARSECTYEQRMAMELLYVDNASFGWDMKIIFKTAWAVIKKKGAI